MGIRRLKKGPKPRPADGASKINMSEPMAPEEARSNIYEDDREQWPTLRAAVHPRNRKVTGSGGERPAVRSGLHRQNSGDGVQRSAGNENAEELCESNTVLKTQSEKDTDTKCADLVAVFENFWDDGEDAGHSEEAAEKVEPPRGGFAIGTPNQSPNQSPKLGPKRSGPAAPLKIFKVGTPPPSPRLEPQEKRGFVPPWPFGPKWPFNCAPTTLELRSLPKGCTSEVIIAQLDAWGFARKCNLVYVENAGVAVVNMARHADGCALASRLHNFSDWKVKGVAGSQAAAKHKRKACRVAWLFTCQGLDALVMKYHQDTEEVWWTPEGQYIGPWVGYSNAFWPLFSPAHMWPIAYAANEWPAEEWPAAQDTTTPQMWGNFPC